MRFSFSRRLSILGLCALAGALGLVFPESRAQKSKGPAPRAAADFARFAPKVATRWDEHDLFVESDGMPDHELMVGIRAWQQQVPLPQPYRGANAWQFPLAPVPAEEPLSARSHFFRGAIAIAVDGVPIFNPIKNDGRTDTFLAGELDLFGGHSGRADDYHYHVAPVFLNGGDPKRPVAYALDGYPIYGYTETDGSPARSLDAFNGHEDAQLGYHYHATKTYPYLNGGFHGQVVEREGQVDPQPHAHPVREATSPLPGARVTTFTPGKDGRSWTLEYELQGKTGRVAYSIADDGSYRFVFTDPGGAKREQIYRPGEAREGTQREPREQARADEGARKPWIEQHLAELDGDGDGKLARAELDADVQRTFDGYDRDRDGRISAEERDGGAVRSSLGGFVREHWSELDADADGALTRAELAALAHSMFEKADRDGDGSVTAEEPAARGPRGQGQGPGRGRRAQDAPAGGFRPEVPEHPFDVVLGRPTQESITVSVRTSAAAEGRLEYGPRGKPLAQRTDTRSFEAGAPQEWTLTKLARNSEYAYRFVWRAKGEGAFREGETCSFRTARPTGREFRFVVQADSHLDEGTDPALYARTLQHEAADAPDFVVDLGDTFMTDKFRGDFREAAALYEAQRWYLGQVARSAPLFLVLGNHDGETRWRDPGAADDMPHWSNALRTKLFPCPAPDGFYAGNARKDELNGLLRDYYAFEWGDALLVALDPFLATRGGGREAQDGWRWTLGAEQYRWLATTLAQSRARWKFVFTHHLVGGSDRNARGGAEAARLFEWGGRDADGREAFDQQRAGWELPIHALLKKHGVAAVFHGHDHFYARQELDGIVYQLVPQPSHPGTDARRMASEYGYAAGEFLASPGHLRVHVTPDAAEVEYVRSALDGKDDGTVAARYVLGAKAATEAAPAAPTTGQEPPRAPREERPRARAKETLAGPESGLSVILGRPTATSITASVLSERALEACLEYHVDGRPAQRTPVVPCAAGTPVELELGGLAADARCGYRLLSRAPGTQEFARGEERFFHTQRAPGSAFRFALQGDSHPERAGKMFDAALYERTLSSVAAEAPDFYLTLGDDFSIERLLERGSPDATAVDAVYAQQRGFLGLVGRSAPLFLVNGNHEQAARYLLDGSAASPAVLAGSARTRYFPLPAPGAFYGGDEEEVEHLGLLRDYYSWTWGDALFVVLDPYWHSESAVDTEAGARRAGKTKGGARRDLWAVTLGEAQYRWLERTLAQSRARWKFVFAHHVLGTGRGGIECADSCEWGGRDPRGDASFAEKRPGWSAPIHALFVKHGVSIFFQGHDHLFAHQLKDGVVYQSTPNPADPSYTAFNADAYRSGDVLPNSGFLRVSVAPEEVRVDYLRSWLPQDESAEQRSGSTAFSYSLRAPR